jgi:hypothetical protein
VSTPPRTRLGRPRLGDKDRSSVSLSVRLTVQEFDALYANASRDRLTLSEFVRRRVIGRGKRERPDDEG